MQKDKVVIISTISLCKNFNCLPNTWSHGTKSYMNKKEPILIKRLFLFFLIHLMYTMPDITLWDWASQVLPPSNTILCASLQSPILWIWTTYLRNLAAFSVCHFVFSVFQVCGTQQNTWNSLCVHSCYGSSISAHRRCRRVNLPLSSKKPDPPLMILEKHVDFFR